MNTTIHKLLPLLLFSILLISCESIDQLEKHPTLKIGVMLPYSGGYQSEWDNALDWVVENINLAGGVAGHHIELVKKDIARNDLISVSEEFISDEDIKAVIGPLTSSDVFEIAPKFISGRKVLMAPVASSANISRAFAGKKYFWRLAEPDISQVKTLLLLAQSGGARTVGLITEDSPYGASFEDWFGYFDTIAHPAIDFPEFETTTGNWQFFVWQYIAEDGSKAYYHYPDSSRVDFELEVWTYDNTGNVIDTFISARVQHLGRDAKIPRKWSGNHIDISWVPYRETGYLWWKKKYPKHFLISKN